MLSSCRIIKQLVNPPQLPHPSLIPPRFFQDGRGPHFQQFCYFSENRGEIHDNAACLPVFSQQAARQKVKWLFFFGKMEIGSGCLPISVPSPKRTVQHSYPRHAACVVDQLCRGERERSRGCEFLLNLPPF